MKHKHYTSTGRVSGSSSAKFPTRWHQAVNFSSGGDNSTRMSFYYYIIVKWMRAVWLVNQLWFIVPVNSWKFRVSSELLYKSNRPQVFMVYWLIYQLGRWKNTQWIRKKLACGSWFGNSSCVLPTSHMVYQHCLNKHAKRSACWLLERKSIHSKQYRKFKFECKNLKLNLLHVCSLYLQVVEWFFLHNSPFHS